MQRTSLWEKVKGLWYIFLMLIGRRPKDWS